MDKSHLGSKVVQYGVSAFICLYFFLAFYPKYLGNQKEIIPFALFNLYTFIPYDYSNFDLQITDSCGEAYFLMYKNDHLNAIERKYFFAWLNKIGEDYRQNKEVKLDSSHFIIENIEGKVDLVRISGDYIETFSTKSYQIEILKQIK